jgi:hypothetical protein
MIEDWIEMKVSSFCYPFYHSHAYLSHAVIDAGYKQARGGAGARYYSARDTIDYFNVDCRQITAGENVDGWLQSGHWHVLTFHAIGTLEDGWCPIPVPEFARQMAELAKHRNARDVEVVAFRDGADRFR